MALTIVTYHYVRDLKRSRYPGIKGRSLDEFDAQLDHIAANYQVVTAEDVIAAVDHGGDLPPNAAWLTFDDGYLDHYANVWPRLLARGWQGTFFPSVRCIRQRELLDVNKIHFVLAVQPDPAPLIATLRQFIDARQTDGLRSFEAYWLDFGKPSRFDPAEVAFVKTMLQRGLPQAARTALLDELFARFVAADPRAFAAELYVTEDQLLAMMRSGMHVGSHASSHVWLDMLGPAAQAEEIDGSLEFLRSLGLRAERWIICYPYGAYNDSLLQMLRERDCAIGLTTRIRVADLKADAPLTLPRIDTNDLPPVRASGLLH
jgi:peptidoglycan/xylan/chitin deacetylase (PgdA/CDA1 family)